MWKQCIEIDKNVFYDSMISLTIYLIFNVRSLSKRKWIWMWHHLSDCRAKFINNNNETFCHHHKYNTIQYCIQLCRIMIFISVLSFLNVSSWYNNFWTYRYHQDDGREFKSEYKCITYISIRFIVINTFSRRLMVFLFRLNVR